MQNLYFQTQYPSQNLSSTFQIPALILPNNISCFPYNNPSSNPPKLSCFDSPSFINSNIPDIPALKLSEPPNFIYQPDPQPIQFSQIPNNIETPINTAFMTCQQTYPQDFFPQYGNLMPCLPQAQDTRDTTPYYDQNCQYMNPMDNVGFSQQVEEQNIAEFTVDDFLQTGQENSEELASPGLAPSCSKNLMEVSNVDRAELSLLELPGFGLENKYGMMIETKEPGIERTSSHTLECTKSKSNSRKKRKVDQDNGVWVKDENNETDNPLKMKKSKSEFHKRKHEVSPPIKREISMAHNLRGAPYDQPNGNPFMLGNLPSTCNNNNMMMMMNGMNGYEQQQQQQYISEKLEDRSTDISSMQAQSSDSPQFMNILPALTPSLLSEENTQTLLNRFNEYFHNGSSLVGHNNNVPVTTQNQIQGKHIGALTVEERKAKIDKYLEKRKKRTWNKKISYDCRKRVADSRLRVKGRFITKNQAFEILKNDGVAYDPNTITMDEIREYLTQKYGDHPMEQHPEKDEDFFKERTTSWGDTESDEMFNFAKKESEDDDDFNSYFNMKGEFTMSPLKFMDMADSFLG